MTKNYEFEDESSTSGSLKNAAGIALMLVGANQVRKSVKRWYLNKEIKKIIARAPEA